MIRSAQYGSADASALGGIFGRFLKSDGPSAALLCAALDASDDCIKLVDTDGRLLFMSGRGREAMEIEDFNAVMNLEWASLWPQESRTRVRAAVAAARMGERSTFEAYCPTAKGAPRWWQVSVAPVRTDGKRLNAVISISRDVTALIETRKALAIRLAASKRKSEDEGLDGLRERSLTRRLLSLIRTVARSGRGEETGSDPMIGTGDEALVKISIIAERWLTTDDDAKSRLALCRKLERDMGGSCKPPTP